MMLKVGSTPAGFIALHGNDLGFDLEGNNGERDGGEACEADVAELEATEAIVGYAIGRAQDGVGIRVCLRDFLGR